MSAGRRHRTAWRRLTATILVAWVAAAGLSSGAAPTARAADPAAAEQARVEAYWSEDRIRGAIPRDMTLDRPKVGSSGPAVDPAVDTAPSAADAVGGASWTGGAILQRSGRILFTLDGLDYSCSGSVIQDGGDQAYSLIITAAHCAYDEATDHFATNWVYIPAWDLAPSAANCSQTTYGCWYARALVVHHGWADEEDLTVGAVRHDYAVAVVGPGGKSATQLDALGAYPVRIGGVASGETLQAFGYPAAPPYDGSDLVYCGGPAGTDPVTGAWGLICDMTGGASGGPWLWGAPSPANGCGWVSSVSSYRAVPDTGRLYGPKLDGSAQAVVNMALAATPDAVGIDGEIASGTSTPIDPPVPFTDHGGSTFCRDIEWLYGSGITSGCTATLYCPNADVTRGQMAAFLSRALGLPSTGTDYFTDDSGSTFESDINRLAKAGITTGCGPALYCPKANMTRGQMAAFLRRALDLPATTTDYFTDDSGSTFEVDINRLAAAGITTGCGPTTYCPNADVTRGQMAAFLRRAFDD